MSKRPRPSTCAPSAVPRRPSGPGSAATAVPGTPAGDRRRPGQGRFRFAGYAGDGRRGAHPQPVDVVAQQTERIPTGLANSTAVLGGGLVTGSVVLIGGDPGIGKSTLLVQALALLGPHAGAVRQRRGVGRADQSARPSPRAAGAAPAPADRDLRVERILAPDRQGPAACWCRFHPDPVYRGRCSRRPARSGAGARVGGAPGALLPNRPGRHRVPGRPCDQGRRAGRAAVLEHMVDTVLYFEGESGSPFRLVRRSRTASVRSTNWRVRDDRHRPARGRNPSAIFLSRHEQEVPAAASW